MFKNVAALLLLSVAFSTKGNSLWESFEAPKLYPNITWAQLQKIHAEQISKMWIVRDGKEWIKVRDWKGDSFGDYDLRELPAWRAIPKEHEVEIHREGTQGRLLARVALKGEKSSSSRMGVLCPPKGMEGMFKVGDCRTLWLGQREGYGKYSESVRGVYPVFDIYPTAAAITYRPPTAREVALAMKNEGKTFVAKLPTVEEVCPKCNGKGKSESKEEATSSWATPSHEKQAENEGGFLSTDSVAYRRARERATRANQPRNLCPRCGGKGKIYEEEFRTLIFKKP